MKPADGIRFPRDFQEMLAVARKMALNAEKYPAEQVRGSARKYTAYGPDLE